MKQGELSDVRLIPHHDEGVVIEKQLAADVRPSRPLIAVPMDGVGGGGAGAVFNSTLP
jgi:hypothetical protein